MSVLFEQLEKHLFSLDELAVFIYGDPSYNNI